MLADKELKKKKKEIDKMEAEWLKAQKDIMKAKVGVSDTTQSKIPWNLSFSSDFAFLLS